MGEKDWIATAGGDATMPLTAAGKLDKISARTPRTGLYPGVSNYYPRIPSIREPREIAIIASPIRIPAHIDTGKN